MNLQSRCLSFLNVELIDMHYHTLLQREFYLFCVYVYNMVYAYLHVEASGQCQMFSLVFWDEACHWASSPDLAGWPECFWDLLPPTPTLPALGLQMVTTTPGFYMTAGGNQALVLIHTEQTLYWQNHLPACKQTFKECHRWVRVAQWLKVPSTHIRWHSTTCQACSKGLTRFWTLQTPGITCIQTYMYIR